MNSVQWIGVAILSAVSFIGAVDLALWFRARRAPQAASHRPISESAREHLKAA